MDTAATAGLYTVTFVYDGDLDLPDKAAERKKRAPQMILELLRQNAFELADFNLAVHYSDRNAKNYISDRKRHRAVAEITLELRLQELESRENIYGRCVKCLSGGNLQLTEAIENDIPEEGILQSVVRFIQK